MSDYKREQFWSAKFNALPEETRWTAIAVMRAERARDLRRLRDELVNDNRRQLERIDDLLRRIERDLAESFPISSEEERA